VKIGVPSRLCNSIVLALLKSKGTFEKKREILISNEHAVYAGRFINKLFFMFVYF